MPPRGLQYEMVERNIVGLILTASDIEDPEVQLVAVRVLARYATYQGKLRKAASSSGAVMVRSLCPPVPQRHTQIQRTLVGMDHSRNGTVGVPRS